MAGGRKRPPSSLDLERSTIYDKLDLHVPLSFYPSGEYTIVILYVYKSLYLVPHPPIFHSPFRSLFSPPPISLSSRSPAP